MDERGLEELVTDVATQLTATDSDTAVAKYTAVLRELVEHLDVDVCFLRTNDRVLDATRLVAEWPPRPNAPDPDPLALVYFRNADPVLAATKNLTDVLIVRPELGGHHDRVGAATGREQTSSATVPLLSEGVTTGILCLVKYGNREWSTREINSLKTVAAIVTQSQARIAALDRLRYLAEHDELTGLANRRALLTELDSRLTAEHTHPVALLLIDVDRLKVVNDALGHAAGDEYLRILGRRLAETLPDDLVARLGGDEFVILLSAPADMARAEQVARQAQQVAREPVTVRTEEVGRSISIGVAVSTPGTCSAVDLLGDADQAALAVKMAGGNSVLTFTDEMRTRAAVRNDIEMHLRDAIRRDELILHYQPEVDLASRRIIGVEALVRWYHPVRGLLQPDSFISIAEATNLAGELGRWVLHEACHQHFLWRSAIPGLALGMRVNVSPAQLIASDFVSTVARVLNENEMEGSDLELEITEHAVIHDLDRVLITLRDLKNLGVQVAIDDFGTGRSSLGQLKSLPVDTLKIDKGFVLNLGTSPDDLAIVRSIIGLAGSFGLDVVAEGVETDLAAQMLLALGCRRAQGFLFSTPVPPATLRRMLHGPDTALDGTTPLERPSRDS